MTENVKTLIEILRKSETLAIDCQCCPAYAVCPSGTISFDNTCLFVKAADTIEHFAETAEKASIEAALYETALQVAIKYQRELEQVKRERDAAINELSYFRKCSNCRKHSSEGGDCYGNHACGNGNPDWEWRGVCAENGGTENA
jgi:hypothetical protein